MLVHYEMRLSESLILDNARLSLREIIMNNCGQRWGGGPIAESLELVRKFISCCSPTMSRKDMESLVMEM